MNFDYPYQQGPDNYVDELGASGGSIVLRSQDNAGRAVSNSGSGWRTVLSATVFGAITGSDGNALMEALMDYLVLGANVNQGGKPAAISTVSLSPSVVRTGRSVQFRTSGPAREVTVLDAAGRTVAAWRLSAGDAATAWNVGTSVTPGAYFLQVRGGGRAETRPFVVVRR